MSLLSCPSTAAPSGAAALVYNGRSRDAMGLKTVRVPGEMSAAFQAAEEVVSRYFADRASAPERGTIEVHGERYVLVRAAALSVEFFSLVRNLYGEGREREAEDFARNILFDLAHAIGKSDAQNFHSKMQLSDPIARLSAGPVHFAHTGWAHVDINPESRPAADDSFYLLYDHPYSFESSAWLAAGRRATFPVCVMNAGYSSGWCEESFGVTLVATELLCQARGDDVCRFVMAHPNRIESRVSGYRRARPELRLHDYQIPDFFARKRIEEELRQSRDELEIRVRKRTAELEEANRRLLQAQKLEAVGRLAGGIAHDFNNLLHLILVRVNLLQKRMGADDPARKELEKICTACGRGSALSRQLLAFSRSQPAERQALELGNLVRQLQDGLLPLLGEDIEVTIALDTDAHIEADPSQLEQVLMNLIVNARHAMPLGGKLRISVDVTETGELTVTTGALPRGRYAVLSVADTGVGMDAETMARVFDPFFTTKPDGQGTGLGLSTVYGIVKETGGGIAVQSEPGGGTCFTLYFPSTTPPAATPAVQAPASRPRREAIRILLVEDQADLRDSLHDMLELSGYEVIAADGALAALDIMERRSAAVDVLLTDIVMPRVSGRELVERVRTRWPEVRVLFMSGYDPDHLTKGRSLGGSAVVLRKPFGIEELTRRIDEVMSAPAAHVAEGEVGSTS